MSEWDDISVADSSEDWDSVGSIAEWDAISSSASTATAEPESSGGILSSLARAPRAFKEGAEAALGSTLNFVTGGYWQDAIGFDEDTEGESYQDAIARRQQRTAMLNEQAAGESTTGGLLLDASTAAGGMAPSLVGGAAVRPATALAATLGLQATSTAPQSYAKARRADKDPISSAVYSAVQTGIDSVTALAGAKIAGKFGGVTAESLFGNAPVRSLSRALIGTAAEGAEEVSAEFLQSLTDIASGVDPDALKNQQFGKTFMVGALLGAAINSASYGAGKAEEFLVSRSRSAARKLGLGETSAKEREAIAEKAKEFVQPAQEQQAVAETMDAPPAPEITPEPAEATAAKNEWMARDREVLGLDELPAAERQSWEQELTLAREQNIPADALSIAQSIVAKPRVLSSTETAGLTIRAAELKNAHEAVMGKIQGEQSDEDFEFTNTERERIEQDFDVLSQALKMAGTEQGRALASRKLAINRDYSLLAIQTRAKAAKKAPLTRPESKKIQDAVQGLAAKETQLQKAVDKAKVRLEELEAHLEAGTLPTTKPRKTAPKELADLQATIAAVRRSLNNSEAAQRKRLEATIARLEARLAAGDFQMPGHRAAPLSPEIERLEFERDKRRNEINVRINELKPRTFREIARQPFDLARTIITSMDLPPVFRQGGMISFGNPVRAGKAAATGFRSMFSERHAHKILKEIDERPNAPLYARAKLYLADLDGLRIHQEEAYVGQLANKIPVLRTIKNASERNYTVFLNKLRADTFDAMVASLPRNGNPTIEEARAIARYINVATGRGDFNARMDTALSEMAAYFFSPRYVASRFQAIIGQPIYRSPKETRTLIAKEYGKMMTGVSVVYGLAMLAGAELDDDGKLKVGDTHIDPLFGMIQTARFIKDNTRAAKNTIQSWATGEDRKLVYSESMGPWRFLRSKFSPIIAAAEDIRTGKDFMGEPTTLEGLAWNFVTPLSFQDVAEATEEQGVPKGLALWLVSLFGVGIQTWEENPANGPRPRRRRPPLSNYAPQ